MLTDDKQMRAERKHRKRENDMTKRFAGQMLIRVMISIIVSFMFYAFQGTDAQAAGMEAGSTAYETGIYTSGVEGDAEAEEDTQEAAGEAFESYYENFVHGVAELVEIFENSES